MKREKTPLDTTDLLDSFAQEDGTRFEADAAIIGLGSEARLATAAGPKHGHSRAGRML